MIKYTCQICNKELKLKNWQGLNNHLRTHKISSKDYWNKYPYQYSEPTGIYGVDYVLCPICNNNRQFQSLTQHIINKHNLSVEEFIVKYPTSKLFTTKYSKLRSEYCRKGLQKNWNNPEYRANRSKYCSEFFSKLNSGSKRPANSKRLSDTLHKLWSDPDYIKMQSDKTKRQHESGNLTTSIINGYRKNWIKYITSDGNIITLKSTYEMQLAQFLDSNNIKYEYEKMYEYYDTVRNKVRKYYADFYLPQYNIVLEVKASWAIDSQNAKDKMISVINSNTSFKFITERELEKLVSIEEFKLLIQGNTNV